MYIANKSLCFAIIRASLVYEIIVRFSWDFYETILVGKFRSREIGEKCASRRSQIITQLYPINCNRSHKHYVMHPVALA